MKNRIWIIKKIDGLIGPLLFRFIPPRKKKQLQKPIRRLLVIRPGGMGDAALLLPVFKEIKRIINDLAIDVLCEQRNRGVFTAVPYVDCIYCYDNPRHVYRLFMNKYDVIVDTEQFYRLSAFLAFFLRGSVKIGFKTNERSKAFHQAVEYDQAAYEVDCFRDLFKTIFPLSNIRRMDDYPYFKRALTRCSWDLGAICVFPGATKKECFWPYERWSRLIDNIGKKGYPVVLLGGKLEKNIAEKIVSNCENRHVTNYVGKLSLLETTQLFNSAKLLISTDSGILHLGVLCGIPTVSLFGSGNTHKWGPKGHQHSIVTKNVSCSPCALFGSVPPCKNDVECMTSISVNEVFGTVLKQLE